MFYLPPESVITYKNVGHAKPEPTAITLQGFPLGENTLVPARQLKQQELAEAIDVKYNPGGQIQTRYPFEAVTTTAIGSIESIKGGNLNNTSGSGATSYTFLTDSAKAYYLTTTTSGTEPTEIGPIEGASKLTPYHDVMLVCDGEYLKYIDSLDEVKIAYDAGTDGHMYDNLLGLSSGSVALSISGVGCIFTTPIWDTEYTIPGTSVEFLVRATTAGTATITAVLVEVAGGTTIATQAYTANDIPTTTPDYLTVVWSSVTAEMEPSKQYRCLLKGTNVLLYYTTVGSGGKMITGGSTPDTTKNPIMRVHPGLPPKADWAIVSNSLWVHDPGRPGGLWRGNSTWLDFSTTGYAGWIGVGDADYNSFPIAKAEDLLGILYVYGGETQPYVCRLEGSTWADYKLNPMFQRIWTGTDTLVNTINALWSASKDGVFQLQSTDVYRDLRVDPVSNQIQDQFNHWVSSTAIAGYYSEDGQFWLYMPTNGHINVCHVSQPISDQNKQTVFPWSRYTIPFTPTVFSQVDSDFYIGGADGIVYKYNVGGIKDLNTTAITPTWTTPAIILRKGDIVEYLLLGSSKTGSSFNISFYVNGTQAVPIQTIAKTFAAADNLTIQDLIDLGDPSITDFTGLTINTLYEPLNGRVNFNCWIIQVKISSIKIYAAPVYFDGLILFYRDLGL